MKCPQCGEPNPAEVAGCLHCGGPLLDVPTGRTGGATDVAQPTIVEPPPGPTLSGEGQTVGIPPEGRTADSMESRATQTRKLTSGALPAGTLFAGRYEIVALIGEGGMGRVYKVRDREIDRTVALKTLRGDEGDTQEAVQRFKQELLLARKITHKNVVRIHDLGESDGVKFFSMEYVEGKSLKALIRERGRVPPAEAATLARQILAGLEEAHAQSVIHRDLKPQNIMVDEAGVARLMDFGIARATDATGMTATGAILGTPDYMSPEQVRGEKAGVAADVFAFGVILYEMLTGDVPYHADTPMSKIVMRLTHKPRVPREVTREIPRYLEHVVLKCMEIDSSLRYQSVGEILADLDRGQVDRSPLRRAKRAVAKKAAAIAVVSALLLVVAAGTYWAVRRGAAPTAAVVPAPAGPPPKIVAILPFTNAAGSAELEWMRSGLPEMVVTDLSQSQYVRPVPAARIHSVLQEAGLAAQSRFDDATLEAVSKATHAQSVISGQFVQSGGRLRLDLALRKAGSGVTIPLKAEAEPAQVFALVDQVSRRIKEQLDLSPDQIKSDKDRPISEVSTASLEALRAYQAALAKMEQGANGEAVALLQKATTADAGFAMAFAKLAEAALSTGQQKEAEAAIARARALAETAPLPEAERYQIHATDAMVKDDAESAARSYGELAKLFPEDPDIQLSLARACKELGRLPEALAAYQRAAQLAPHSGAALLGLGEVQVRSGHAEEAITTLQEALATRQFDREPEALGMIHSILGVACRETGKMDKALEHLTLSLDIRTKLGDKRGQGAALQNLASVYEYRGEVAKALEAQQKALSLYRALGNRAGESLILNAMGQTWRTQGNLERALEVFRQSMEIERERKDPVSLANRLNQIADIYRRKGQYDDALVYLEQARTHLAPTDEKKEKAVNLEYMGLVRKAQGLYPEALEAFQAALPLYREIEHEMSVGDVHLSLANIYESQGRYGDAFGAVQQSLQIYEKLHVEHDLAHAHLALARLLLVVGLADDAEKHLAEADHGSGVEAVLPEVLLIRGRLLVRKGKAEEAARAFEQGNVKANLSGEKEVAVESRLALARLSQEQGRAESAERLLRKTRDEAARARLRPLEAAVAAQLAEVLLSRGDFAGSLQAASDAVALAEKFMGRPTQWRAYVLQGDALEKLGRSRDALDAYARAVATLDWIRGSLRPEHVEPFMRQAGVQTGVARAVAALEKGGRTADAAPLKAWSAPAR